MFVLPQTDELRAFGGVPCNAPLLDLVNDTDLPVRLEARLGGESEAWHCLVPFVASGTSWAAGRVSPLYIPRIASLRVVSCLDGRELLTRSPWGEGGALEVPCRTRPG